MLVRFRYIKKVKNRLKSGRISVSDAILSVLKLCRGAVPEARLYLLNRELLGYLDEESEDLVVRLSEAGSITTAWQNDGPRHRLLVGSWVPLAASSVDQHSLTEEISNSYLFYGDGICELEALLERLTISEQAWISVATDKEQNRVFMCTTAALQNIYDLAKSRLCEYMEYLAQEVLTASIEDGAAEAQLILLLTQRGK